jgi:F-type H+-transporting ATPase subunit b
MGRVFAINPKFRAFVLIVACATAMFVGLGTSPRASAQESRSVAPARIVAGTAVFQETAKDLQEEEQSSDPTASLKHSAAVRWISRKTGLSLDQTYWACVVLNFAIVFFAIWIPLRKRLPGMFKSRTEAIHQRIEEARKASEEARSRLTEVEGRLARLDSEIAAMRREADENARAEEKRIMAEAEEERKRIVAAAEQEIGTAASAARRDLKAYAGELAVDLAAKRIQVGEDADQALVREFTSQLGKDGNY